MMVIVSVISAYLLGALPFGYMVGKTKGIDIRSLGSGNTGATNVFRALGPGFALLVLALDLAKGTGAASIGMRFMGIDPAWGAVICGLTAIVGHVYSIFLRFKGGKGVATAAGVLLFLAPPVVALGICAYALVVLATRYSSLGTLTAVAVAVISMFVLEYPLSYRLAVLLAALFIVWRHRGNISRLLAGKELRLGRRSQ